MNEHYTFEEAKGNFKKLAHDLIYINSIKTNSELSALACGFNNVLISALGITFEQVKEIYAIADEIAKELK